MYGTLGAGVEMSAIVTLGARSTGSLSELKQSIGRVNVGKRWILRSRAHFDARRV